MAGESNEKKVMVTVLLTSTLLTMLGIAGVLRGAYDFSAVPGAQDGRDLFESEAEVHLFEAQISNPYRRPMAAANVVVSALVLIGSFMLSWRRRIAQWWIKQAVVAKLLWIIAYTVSLVYHLKVTFPPLPHDHPGGGLPEVVSSVVIFGSLSAALHVAAAYRATRSDIRQFIESSAEP